MNGKFDAYYVVTYAQKNWIVDQSIARDFTLFTKKETFFAFPAISSNDIKHPVMLNLIFFMRMIVLGFNFTYFRDAGNLKNLAGPAYLGTYNKYHGLDL